MYKPRRVVLTEAERRELQVIEHALTAEDPTLAALLHGTPSSGWARRKCRARRAAWTYILMSTFLFVVGIGGSDTGLISLGLVLLMIAPAVVACIVEFARRWPPSESR